MRRQLKKVAVAMCLFAAVVCSTIGALAKTTYPTTNDVWEYGTETVSTPTKTLKYTYSDYINGNNVTWYTASVTDKQGTIKAKDKRTNGKSHAHARWDKKSGNQVWYNFK